MRRFLLLATVPVALAPAVARADEPVTLRDSWSGPVTFFTSGASLAVDGADGDTTNAEVLLAESSLAVTTADVPVTAEPLAVLVYWGGSIVNDDCAGGTIDDTVDFTPPGGAPSAITADACYCSTAGAGSYDVQVCRKDVSSLVTALSGSYTVGSFSALIDNDSTNNASFSLVIVYRDKNLPPRRIGLYDGLLTMSNTVNTTALITLDQLEVDDPPEGSLTWYVLEGDVGGTGTEQVEVTGVPGGSSLLLGDADNPTDNPMNHTINTTTPVQPDVIGVDIDRFAIDGALEPADTSVEILYSAGSDKWWIAYNIVGVNVYEPLFGTASYKAWTLELDADGNEEPSPGDTVRYQIHLQNTGSAPGMVDVADAIPTAAASWQLVDDGGGSDGSNATLLSIGDVVVNANQGVDVTFDVVLADLEDETIVGNQASFDATPDGDQGTVTAPDLVLRRDGDGDLVFDHDDNCPSDANADQADGDDDGVGDACEGSTSGGGAGGAPGAGGASGAAAPSTGGGSGSEADDDAGDVTDSGGCGCRMAGAPARGGVAAALLFTALTRRRRRAA